MSRLGNKPIKIPSGVKVNVQGAGVVSVEGPKGKLSNRLPETIKVEVKDDEVSCNRVNDEIQTRADHGLVWSVIRNMIQGVTDGFSKTLVSIGVGYRMNVQGQKLNINAGFSHPVEFELPKGITGKVAEQTKLTLEGADKELLGSVADKIRKIRPPEPYKGKGIRYEDERVQLKEGKAAGK